MARSPNASRLSATRIAEADSVVVIGLGRFGKAVSRELMAAGTDVLGIDLDEEIVQSMSAELTHVVRADSTNEEALRQLGVPEFERAVVAIGIDIQSSILTTSILMGFGIPHVWAKAISETHGRIFNQLGVPHVIYPEQDMGRRVAHMVRGAALDYIEIDRDFEIVRMSPNSLVLGTTLGEGHIRSRFGVTVLAYNREGQGWVNADADTVLQPGDNILVSGSVRSAEAFGQLR